MMVTVVHGVGLGAVVGDLGVVGVVDMMFLGPQLTLVCGLGSVTVL